MRKAESLLEEEDVKIYWPSVDNADLCQPLTVSGLEGTCSKYAELAHLCSHCSLWFAVCQDYRKAVLC